MTLVDGALVLYLERGGRSALAFSDDEEVLAAAARSLVETSRARRLDTLTVEQVSGVFVYGTAVVFIMVVRPEGLLGSWELSVASVRSLCSDTKSLISKCYKKVFHGAA